MNNEIKLRRGQKCWGCKKEIKGEWAYNGHFWHQKCKDKDSDKRIREYLKSKVGSKKEHIKIKEFIDVI